MAGPPAALIALCTEQHPRLVRMLDLCTGDLGTAEELAQETLVRACERWATVRALDDPGAWLRTVALNLARSRWRRRAAERRANARTHARAQIRDPGPDHADAMAVRDALATLAMRPRQALVLRYVVGLDHAGIAHALGTTTGNARVIVHRALGALGDALGRDLDGDDLHQDGMDDSGQGTPTAGGADVEATRDG